MNALVAAQVAFCFLVHFVAGLFVSTFDRLSNQPTGFSSERVLVLDVVAKGNPPPSQWDQVAEHLRNVAGVESASVCEWPLMSGNTWTQGIWVNRRAPDEYGSFMFGAAPGWFETMRMPLIDGRDFRADEAFPDVAVVNQAFAQRFFEGQNPVGKYFERRDDKGKYTSTRIVGWVRDARYRNMREAIRATVYVPFQRLDNRGGVSGRAHGTLMVRTKDADPTRLASLLRQEVPRARSEFRVSNIVTQEELVRQHTIRERLLATLSMFFAGVALVLAGVGLYGVLNYSVLQRRREIGIRMALGARGGDVARRVIGEVFGMLLVGAVAGLAAGIASGRYVETLLYQVKTTDIGILALPALTIFGAALLASLPPVWRAVRIDPATTLRAE